MRLFIIEFTEILLNEIWIIVSVFHSYFGRVVITGELLQSWKASRFWRYHVGNRGLRFNLKLGIGLDLCVLEELVDLLSYNIVSFFSREARELHPLKRGGTDLVVYEVYYAHCFLVLRLVLVAQSQGGLDGIPYIAIFDFDLGSAGLVSDFGAVLTFVSILVNVRQLFFQLFDITILFQQLAVESFPIAHDTFQDLKLFSEFFQNGVIFIACDNWMYFNTHAFP